MLSSSAIMNRLTEKEFYDRVEAIARARRIFINLTDGNITDAFTLYQEVLADQDREVIITTLTSGNRPPAAFDKFDRPKCPECGADLMFRPLNENPEGYKVMLSCSNPTCNTVLYSENDILWWAEELKRGSEQTKEGE